jgi:hypothetical protein
MVRPDECLIGFGIPLSEEAFQRQAQSPDSRDFIRSQRLTWNSYRFRFADSCQKVLEHLRLWGVRVVGELTLQAFADAFSRPPRVIILFAHWSDTDGTVELADGLVSCERLVDLVPKDFSGAFDLCVCHPRQLVVLLKQKFPDCPVKFTEKQANALSWIYMYEVLFKILSTEPADYFEALADAFKHLSDPVI